MCIYLHTHTSIDLESKASHVLSEIVYSSVNIDNPPQGVNLSI